MKMSKYWFVDERGDKDYIIIADSFQEALNIIEHMEWQHDYEKKLTYWKKLDDFEVMDLVELYNATVID
jgi:hypothetical protein